MSVNIVEESCLNKIINFLRYEDVYSNRNNGQCEKLLNKMGYDLENDDDCEALFKDMLELNIQAVEVRYPDTEAHPERIYSQDFSLKDNNRVSNPGIYQALKSIQSWLYECMEMESQGLYVTFRKIMNIINASIIRKKPEYKKAVWV